MPAWFKQILLSNNNILQAIIFTRQYDSVLRYINMEHNKLRAYKRVH